MRGAHFCLGLLLLSSILGSACRRLPEGYEERGVRFVEAIPADVGKLVGITPARPNWARLWYEKPDGSLVVVTVNGALGRVNERIVTIPRR